MDMVGKIFLRLT